MVNDSELSSRVLKLMSLWNIYIFLISILRMQHKAITRMITEDVLIWQNDSVWLLEHSYSDFICRYHYENNALRHVPSFVNTYHREKRENQMVIWVCFHHSTNTISPREKWYAGLVGFEPAFSCLKWSMCLSYPDSTWENSPESVPLHHPTLLNDVSALISDTVTVYPQSGPCKTTGDKL